MTHFILYFVSKYEANTCNPIPILPLHKPIVRYMFLETHIIHMTPGEFLIEGCECGSDREKKHKLCPKMEDMILS